MAGRSFFLLKFNLLIFEGIESGSGKVLLLLAFKKNHSVAKGNGFIEVHSSFFSYLCFVLNSDCTIATSHLCGHAACSPHLALYQFFVTIQLSEITWYKLFSCLF